MKIWKAHYKDKYHDKDIEILNTEGTYGTSPLSFCINGISFVGNSLGDFELENDEMYEKAKKEFNILNWQRGLTKQEYYELQRYEMDVKIPVNIVRKKDDCVIQGELNICFNYSEHNSNVQDYIINSNNVAVYRDDVTVSIIVLCVEDKEYNVNKKNLNFEDIFLQLCKMMKEKYTLKSCFTCQFSEYSPYGNDDFGAMLCYKKNKEEYLKVNDKRSYFKYLDQLECETRQETYLCDEFEPRVKCEGYRGFIE